MTTGIPSVKRALKTDFGDISLVHINTLIDRGTHSYYKDQTEFVWLHFTNQFD